MTDQQPPLNGAQLALVEKTVRAALERMELRKWAVEMALANGGKIHDALEIYAFVSGADASLAAKS